MHDRSTEKRLALDAARHYEQIAAVSRLITAGEMASALAHELNQPLSAIATYTGAAMRLLDKLPPDLRRVREALHEIEQQSHRAGDTIQRMRELATRHAHKKSDIELHAVIAAIQPLVQRDAESNNVALTFDIEKDMPNVTADAQQIEQVLLHLLRNGVEAMSATPFNQRNLELSVRLQAPVLARISVSDNGHGVSEDHRKLIFDPFFTTKPTGTGMGLAICKSLLEAHGTNLQYTHNSGGGVTFFFTLSTSG